MGVLALLRAAPCEAAHGVYETNLDPGVGFNLISWSNNTTGAHWVTAIDRMYQNGFRHVSLSPLRFANINTGQLLTDAESAQGSPLSSLVVGLERATQLGMKVTLNPFIEPYNPTPTSGNQYFAEIPGTGGCTWRGCWNPSGAVRDTFFASYQAYLQEIATLAQQYGVERMSVGTELNALDANSSNNPHWDAAIDAVDAIYTGQIGYAANWDRFLQGAPSNFTTAIFNHPAIDYVGVDSYFTGLVTQSAADASGGYPNQTFIDQVEAGWNNLLDTRLLPYAAARNGGRGLPLVFTEFGHLPRNRTALDPQQQAQSTTQALDTAEQRMAFEGFFNAIDGRQNLIPEIAIWQWDMFGGTSDWSINTTLPTSGGARNNNNLASWLLNFVATATVSLPGDFNVDGTVDAADYTVWRDQLGASVALPNEEATPGQVTQEDYLTWRNAFGASAATGGAALLGVPEPSAVAIALLTCGGSLGLWRRRRAVRATADLC